MPPSDKICMVCGDKALGYNFNAVTCESCKAFFRRNALSNKEFTCPFNGNCEISVVTRRFCQKCRLEKCFTVGMRKDYIMSEEDKILKKIKMENNRTKRKVSCSHGNDDEPPSIGGGVPIKIKRETPDYDGGGDSEDNNSCDDCANDVAANHNNETFSTVTSSNSIAVEPLLFVKPFPTMDSPSSDIVDRLVDYPEDATKLINHLMKTPSDAVAIMTKILNSQKDAMRFIGHLISAPGDALKIISKIMNSPFDALTVFTKFMSSPTDALDIIAKIASSPNDVLQFIQQLMNRPEDAVQIMNKFMNSPAEALKLLNKMVNVPATLADSTTPSTTISSTDYSDKIIKDNPMIKSMLEIHADRLNTTLLPNALPTPSSQTTSNIPLNNCCDNKNDVIGDTNILHQHQQDEICSSDKMENIMEDVNAKPIQPNSLEAVICEAIKLEYEASGFFIPPPINGTTSRDLNDAERAKLNELIVANKALYAPLDEDLSGLDECINETNQNSQDPQLLKIINLTAIAIRRLIKMSKKINAFKNMCQEDQVALLKGGCTEMMILRSVIQYDIDHAKWKIPHSQEQMSSISVDVLKLAKGNVYEEHESFIRTFETKWRKDENIILIMCAIVLFTPNRPRVVHADVLKLEQNSYYYLLRRYLESIYSGCEAKSTFLKLIKKIGELQRLNDVIIGVYLDVNPSQVEPLLREIFDLKNH